MCFATGRSMVAIAVLWGVLTIATSLIPGAATSSVGFILVSLITVRFLVGMVHAPVFPVINCSIERWFSMGGWALPTVLCSTGLTLGFAAAAPVLVWMIAQWGWRTAGRGPDAAGAGRPAVLRRCKRRPDCGSLRPDVSRLCGQVTGSIKTVLSEIRVHYR